MIGKNFIFDGNAIPYTTGEAQTNKWIADVDLFRLRTESSQINRQDFHGTISSPTFGRGRLIPVSGEVFAEEKTDRGTTRKVVEDVFQLEDFPNETDAFKKLEFTDDDGLEWFIFAKVFTKPEFRHERAGAIIEFDFNLYADDPLIRSKVNNTAGGNYGVVQGFVLPVALPAALSGSIEEFTDTNTGNFASPVKFTITGEIVNPRLINLTTGKFWRSIVTVTTGDSLVVDTDAKTATLNGGDILPKRGVGSNWIFATKGLNTFLLTGDDWANDPTAAAVTIEFPDARM